MDLKVQFFRGTIVVTQTSVDAKTNVVGETIIAAGSPRSVSETLKEKFANELATLEGAGEDGDGD